MALTQEYFDKITPELKPVHIRDVNGDGIEDRIVPKRAERSLMPSGLLPTLI
jgi:hypothetical protein